MAIEQLERVGEYVTLKQAAKDLNVKPNTLYCWMRKEGKPIRMIGRVMLIRPSEVQDYEQYRSH